MSLLELFLTSFGAGIAVAAPVGPMSVLCMRRTLTEGPRTGLAVGLGIATADGIYGLVAALGLVGLTRFLLAYDRPLHLAAGLFLVYLGIRTLTQKPAELAPNGAAAPLGPARAAYWPSLFLTLTNPPTIIMFAALITTLAPQGQFSTQAALTTVLGVFCGSIAWWCVLVAVVTGAHHLLSAAMRRWIDRAAGLALAVFGVAQIRRAI